MLSNSPPWTKKKRFHTSVKMASLIGGSAFALGSVVFAALVFMGIVKPFSLKGAVEAEVAKNPSLVNAFYSQLSDSICFNTTLNFKVIFNHPLKASIGNENNQCTEFVVTNSGGHISYIKIEHKTLEKEKIINSLIENLQNVESNAFNHPLYEASIISGYSNNLYLNAIVIAPSANQSVTLLFYPADPNGSNAFKKLAASYQLL